MKVGLFSFHNFLRPGGVKNHILGLYEQFKKKKIETKIIAPRRKIFENYGKDVILLGTSFEIHFGGGESDFDIVFTPFSIEKKLKNENFDVWHFHNLIFPAALQFLNSPLAQKPLKILTFHSNLRRSKLLERFPIIISILNKISNWKIDGLICVSEFLLEFFQEYKGPKTVIPNGIDLEKFSPKNKKIKKFLDGKINILFVGRIEERKGVIYLLKAYQILEKKFKNLRLIIVGDGGKMKECKKFAKNQKLKNVHFEGVKDEIETSRYYATADIVVAPSIFGESFGIVLLEAMASQKPIVATNIEGFKEVLPNKDFLATPQDHEDLAKKIEILIKNPQLREVLGKQNRNEVKKYSWENISERVLEFYHFCQKVREEKRKA